MLMYLLRTTGQNSVKQEGTGLSKRGEDKRAEEEKWGPGKYRAPADIGHSVLQETMSEST